MTDEKLMGILKEDPERGMRKLVSQYGGLAESIIRNKLRSSDFCAADIEDCLSQTFMEFWTYARNADVLPSGIKGLLCVMAKRNALDLLRKRYRTQGEVPIEDVRELHGDSSIESDLEEKELRAEVVAAIMSLEEPDKEILIRKFYIGEPSKEIAKRLGLSVSNVDTRTHRAISKLREKIGRQ